MLGTGEAKVKKTQSLHLRSFQSSKKARQINQTLHCSVIRALAEACSGTAGYPGDPGGTGDLVRGLRLRLPWVQVLVLALTSGVPLGTLLNISEPRFPHL